MAIVLFAVYVTILEIFTIKMCMILTLTFRMGQGKKCKYTNRKAIYVTSYLLQCLLCLSPYDRNSQSKCTRPLEWTNVNCKYVNGTAVYDCLLAIVMFTPSVTFFMIFTVKMHMTLTLISIMNQVVCKYANWKATCGFIRIGKSNVCPICQRLRDIISQNVYDLDFPWSLELAKVKCKYANRKPLATFYLLAIAIFVQRSYLRDNHITFPFYSIWIVYLENEGQRYYDLHEN